TESFVPIAVPTASPPAGYLEKSPYDGAVAPSSLLCCPPGELGLRRDAEDVARAEARDRVGHFVEHLLPIRRLEARDHRRERSGHVGQHRPELGDIAGELRQLDALLTHSVKARRAERLRKRTVGGEVEDAR